MQHVLQRQWDRYLVPQNVVLVKGLKYVYLDFLLIEIG